MRRLKKRATHIIGIIEERYNEFKNNPMSWQSIFWDFYYANEFPDMAMKFSRILIGLVYLAKMITLPVLGIFLFIDGLYSVFRHRFELHLTKDWHEDVPRVARAFFGFVLMKSIF